ncbi:benzoyl-CoA reductase electron transfer protein, putative [Citrifermentans bemidjiense Bem]|uniref:Benzoyl-CoA reductase electron transfer protein, putative n=1 Tax=Citrifermentans bemidjiense (strain ATCC BAA-1014 / DSM 16622 / JCM 12645 / Bem) TaxID=404380 RepID=B5E7T2_CITBB|nr:NADH-quinone oxidoreductase subunit NuoF [Citrifermentans bemidjiense]ACH38468.1 benzoyl-CoA reductase electron transfer protein, putative [Citrifermentans bemidjiense Bem]
MPRIKSPAELEAFRKAILAKRDDKKPCITLCSGSACHATGSEKVADAILAELESHGLKDQVDIRRTGCHGFCEQGPIVVVYPEGISYLKVKPEDVCEIVSHTFKEKKLVERLLYVDPNTGDKSSHEHDIPFYKNQQRLILGLNTKIDPKSLEDYLAVGGYQAMAKALLQMTPEEVIGEVKGAKLRGRGGAGFPSGTKWEFARNAPGDQKYVVVNCDEGDPGAYMDRSLMEGNPFTVLEGLLIGAYAIGASEGYIYVRQEYPLAVDNLTVAIKKAEEHGFLGKNILGSGFDFTVKVHRGAGAFICGEETSLLQSLEGKPGEPKPRPPFPAVRGLWGKPTNINNVETWANIPVIINKGADYFSSIGTESSKGTKIFSLVGKVNNTGLVEVPMGMPLRDIIFKIGGGVPNGKKFKAVQTGGPSGGCIPEEYLDVKVDFDELMKMGAMMGSGGMIVMDEDTCLVDIARYFLEFLSDESCGKCVPCREGIRQMLKVMTAITQGKGKEGDIELLENMAMATQGAALCALGKTAPNPVLSTLKYFRHEYEAHIKEKRCPALSCKELIAFHIDPAKCKGCGSCLRKCPATAIEGGKKTIHVIDQEKCTKCGTCIEACPAAFHAISKLSGVPVPEPPPQSARAIA